MGNLRSVAQALMHAAPEAKVMISSKVEEIKAADKVVLPGQGAMPDCMSHLQESGLLDAVLEASRTKPMLGVCVGEQMLFESSTEVRFDAPAGTNVTPGLGLLPGKVIRFDLAGKNQADGSHFKVPHMGWNNISKQDSVLYNGISEEENFYFVHSYYAEICQETTAVCDYIVPFSASMQKDNFYATQFHPEKSGTIGAQVLSNFLKL